MISSWTTLPKLNRSFRTVVTIAVSGLALLAIPVNPVTASATRQRPEAEARIVGGHVAQPSQWPWMAAVLAGDAFCGGTLIAPQMVLTAAHCVTNPNLRPADVRVVIGRSKLSNSDGETFNITQITVPDRYRLETASRTQPNDLALLRLSGASTATSAALVDPTQALADGELATAAGWGLTKEDGQFLANSLREAQFPLWSQDRCSKAYKRFDPDVMICGGLSKGGVDTCQGDSGGPLMIVNTDGRSQLVGVTSWGEGCARPRKPGVYASLFSPSLRGWLVNQMAQPPDTSAPSIDGLSVRPTRVRAGRSAKVRIHVSERAMVRLRVQRVHSAGNSQHTRTVLRGARVGNNVFQLPSRIRGRFLTPGRYQVVVQAIDFAGNRSQLARVRLLVR